MKRFHDIRDTLDEPRRPGVCYIFGLGNSKSTTNVSSYTTTQTTNNAYDNRNAATDQAVIIGENGSLTTVVHNNTTDAGAVDAATQIALDAGLTSRTALADNREIADAAIKASADAADIAVRGAIEAAGRTTAELADSYDASLGQIGRITDDAFGFGQTALGLNTDLSERAIQAVMQTAEKSAAQSGAVVTTALDSLIEADKSSEERAFQNITKMVVIVAIAAAAAYALPRLK